MTPTWPHEKWNESRFHTACFQIGQRWIQGGVVYGYAAQPESPTTKNNTDQICQHVLTRLLRHSHGMRFIAGDFNQPDGALPSMQQLKEAGWINAQQWALERLNQPIQPTCKNKTVKDHLYVSPELAEYLKEVIIMNDWFPDHAVLVAKFRTIGKPPKLPIWRQPKPIPWDDAIADEVAANFRSQQRETSDLTTAYTALCKDVELAAAAAFSKRQGVLSDASHGRAQTLEVKWRQEYSTPIRKSREGEFQPTYHGINIQHARWIRQYRRLINLSRMDPAKPGHAYVHRMQLWQSIRTSAGFHPDFPTWWKNTTNCSVSIDHVVPDKPEVIMLCNSFHEQLQAFEKSLNQQRIQDAKQRRLDDPMLIFRDLKNPPPQPVSMLLEKAESIITHVDHDDVSVEFSKEANWTETSPVYCGQHRAEIIHATPDKLWLTTVDGLQPGETMTQEAYIGDLTDLFDRFGKEWTRRWDKHLDVEDDRWEPVISFAEKALPKPPPMEYRALTVADWDEAVKKKSRKAATGPDGVSKADLLHWPNQAKQILVDIFNKIEQGCPWPRQMVTGFVVALEKTPGAATVNQYRPITLFSLCYRIWGSIRAKQILQHLQPYAPCTCTGNLPGRYSAQVWYGVMQEIELAQLHQTQLSGWVIDLIKAFNLIPRVPIMCFMKALNVAPAILTAWMTALTTVERRFKLHNCVGPGLRSCTGFPEGCALSVCAMLAHNLVAHAYLRLRHPHVTLWSYVDNIEATAPNAQRALAALEAFHSFSQVMDVSIDVAKSYTWSVQADQRKALRADAQVTKLSARDLGGHVQYSKVVTNSTITERCESIKVLWGRLHRSLAPYSQKLRALVSKAWPSCLHGISSVHLADDHYDKLRTGALQGLGERTNGASPIVHLSLLKKYLVIPNTMRFTTRSCTSGNIIKPLTPLTTA